MKHNRKPFCFWVVRAIAKITDESLPQLPPPAPASERNASSLGIFDSSATGWVYVSNQNIGNKHDEKVFLEPPKAGRRKGPTELKGDAAARLQDQWSELIGDYKREHPYKDTHQRPGPRGKTFAPTG